MTMMIDHVKLRVPTRGIGQNYLRSNYQTDVSVVAFSATSVPFSSSFCSLASWLVRPPPCATATVVRSSEAEENKTLVVPQRSTRTHQRRYLSPKKPQRASEGRPTRRRTFRSVALCLHPVAAVRRREAHFEIDGVAFVAGNRLVLCPRGEGAGRSTS